MATADECRQALAELSSMLATNPEAAEKVNLDRTLDCHIRDLDTHFHARLRNGAIVGITDGAYPAAQIKLAMTSDDLLALVAGKLHLAAAWTSGRVSIRASFGDLLKLRKLL